MRCNRQAPTTHVYRIRRYAKEMPIEDAVERTITECIAEGILADFLKKNRAEAKKMSIYEYNEEAHMRMLQEDSYTEGHEAGQKNGAAKMLVDNVESIISTLHADMEKACQILRITPTDYFAAKKLLNEQPFAAESSSDSRKNAN